VVDILKITSAVPASSKVDNLPKQLPGGAVFDINRPDEALSYRVTEKKEGGDEQREALLRNLSREIFSPLKTELTAQSEELKKLFLFLRFFNNPAFASANGSANELFMKPQDLLNALMAADKDVTLFKGELFEALRVLAENDGYSKLKDIIANLLRAFDSHVNMGNTAKSIYMQTEQFTSMLKGEDAAALRGLLTRMESLTAELMKGDPDTAQRRMSAFLKQELLPVLTETADKYRFISGDRLTNRLMTIVHNVVRFDKADLRLLTDAVAKLGEELKSYGRFTDADAADMRRLLFSHLNEAVNTARLAGMNAGRGGASAAQTGQGAAETNRAAQLAQGGAGSEAAVGRGGADASRVMSGALAGQNAETAAKGGANAAQAGQGAAEANRAAQLAQGGAGSETDAAKGGLGADRSGTGAVRTPGDITDVIARALEISSTERAAAAAQNLLNQLVQNESPVFSLIHFLFPVRFLDEEIYSEFYVDKDAKEKDGGGEDVNNIFFIIRSEKFGDFEVDLLAKGRNLDLDIKCPAVLEDDVKGMRNALKKTTEACGYNLSAYKVGVYTEERSIMQKFPNLAMRKAGIDVRV
jgi:hypothetical protein